MLIAVHAVALPLGEKVLYEQGALISRATGIDEERIERHLQLQQQLFSILKNETDVAIAETQLRESVTHYLAALSEEERTAVATSLEAQLPLYTSKWFRYFLTYEPAPFLRQVKVPLLALYGELDLQVSLKQNLPALDKILREAGHKEYTIIEFPHLNHLFQTSETGSPLEYAQIEETIAPLVLRTLSDGILQKTAGDQLTFPMIPRMPTRMR